MFVRGIVGDLWFVVKIKDIGIWLGLLVGVWDVFG